VQKEADRPSFPQVQTGQRPVFAASSGQRRVLVRLMSRLIAVGMLALVTLIIVTTFSPVHDSAPSWPVSTIGSR
jgi:hypothetical protein